MRSLPKLSLPAMGLAGHTGVFFLWESLQLIIAETGLPFQEGPSLHSVHVPAAVILRPRVCTSLFLQVIIRLWRCLGPFSRATALE